MTINKQGSLDFALFSFKGRKKQQEHERSVGGNTSR